MSPTTVPTTVVRKRIRMTPPYAVPIVRNEAGRRQTVCALPKICERAGRGWGKYFGTIPEESPAEEAGLYPTGARVRVRTECPIPIHAEGVYRPRPDRL